MPVEGYARIAFSHDSQFLAIFIATTSLSLYNLSTKSLLWSRQLPNTQRLNIAFSPRNRFIISYPEETDKLVAQDVNTGIIVQEFSAPVHKHNSIRFVHKDGGFWVFRTSLNTFSVCQIND